MKTVVLAHQHDVALPCLTRLVALGTAFLSACANESSQLPSARPETGVAVDAGHSYLPDLDAIECEPTLDSLRGDVFAVACGFDSCHGNNNAAWGLYLVTDDLAEELIGRRSALCRDWDRVVPGAPERSFLVQKLVLDRPPCGVRMPFGLPRLPERVLACITGWIESLPHAAGMKDAAAER